MGISCASQEFTEAIRRILEGCLGQLNMTDDILVWGRDERQEIINRVAVLKRLSESGITLNLEKCEFGVKELTFFGLRLTGRGFP